jgi:hypothetical protein
MRRQRKMKKMFLGLGVSMFLLFVLSFPSIAGDSSGNGSQQLNQGEPAGNVYQYQFQQANPMNESGSGPSSETPAGARNGALDCTGPLFNIASATAFEATGTVASILPGSGLELDLDGTTIYIFGIGPNWFWEKEAIDRPAVGETITVSGYLVNYDPTTRYIATSITFADDGTVITLRDVEGYPLWRFGRAMRAGQADQTTP